MTDKTVLKADAEDWTPKTILKMGQDWIDSATQKRLLQQGIEQGIQKGELIGEAKVIHRQLMRRFKPLPEWVLVRVLEADQSMLELWADRILDAKTLHDIFK